MKYHLRYKAQQEILEEPKRQPEIRPVMSPLQHLQHITIELHGPIKILLLKHLYRYLVPSLVLFFIFLVLKGNVAFDWAIGEFDFVVFAWREDRREVPKGREEGKGYYEGDDWEEVDNVEGSIEKAGKEKWNAEEEDDKVDVGETFTTWAVGREDSGMD